MVTLTDLVLRRSRQSGRTDVKVPNSSFLIIRPRLAADKCDDYAHIRTSARDRYGSCVVMVVTGGGAAAQAGTVLLARESTIRATGTAGCGGLRPARRVAGLQRLRRRGRHRRRRRRRPARLGQPALAAVAERRRRLHRRLRRRLGQRRGSRRRRPRRSEAVSNFDLTFQVLGVPSLVSFGGSVGVSGDGSTTRRAVQRIDRRNPALRRNCSPATAKGSRSSTRPCSQPGVYELSRRGRRQRRARREHGLLHRQPEHLRPRRRTAAAPRRSRSRRPSGAPSAMLVRRRHGRPRVRRDGARARRTICHPGKSGRVR